LADREQVEREGLIQVTTWKSEKNRLAGSSGLSRLGLIRKAITI
jgi:hypothetical protein